MSRRFVAISDLHAHPWAAFASGDGRDNDRLQRTLGVLRESLARAKQLDCPWVFGGDLVHTAGYALNIVLSQLAEEFARAPGVQKLVVWGNHDARGIGGRITLDQTVWGSLLRSVENLQVLDPSISPSVVEAGGITFSGAGAQPRPELWQPAMQSHVGIYHGTVRGSVGPNGYVFPHGLDPDELLQRHRFVVAGDLHHPQSMGSGQRVGDILIPGSPEHHNFGDAGIHGWWIVSLPGGTLEFVDSRSPMFLTVQTTQEVQADGNFYRVLTRTLNKLPKNAIAISPEPTVVQARPVMRGLTGEQILSAWMTVEGPPETVRVSDGSLLALGKQLISQSDVGQLQSMRLRSISLQNFCSYMSEQLVIHDGAWLVLGKGKDYPSNGAGKSTLFEALYWLLFGRTTKGLTGDDVIRWGTQQCAVVGEFQDQNGNTLQVMRSRGASSVLAVEENGVHWEATSVNDMTEKLGRRLGLTPELFQALGYFSQERLLLFASATDGERKDMLADLIGLSAYQDAATMAQRGIDKLTTDVAVNEGQQRAYVERLEAARANHSAVAQRREEWEHDRSQRVASAQRFVAEFDEQEETHRADLMAEAVSHLSKTNEKNTREMMLNWESAQLALERLGQTQMIVTPERLALARVEAQDALNRVIQVRAQAEANDKQLSVTRRRLADAVRLVESGTCPLCMQPILSGAHEACLGPVKAEVAVLERTATQLIAEQGKWVKTAADLKVKLGACEASAEQASKAEAWIKTLDATKDALVRLKQEREDIQATALQHVNALLQQRRATLVSELSRVSAESNPHTATLTSTALEITGVETALVNLQARHGEMAQSIACYDYWRRAFSKQGIQSLLMDEVAGAFNAERGAIMPALTQGVYDVQLSTLSRTKAGEARERTEFKIYEHGEVVPYQSLSGGQRRRIDVGVMLTLVKAISRWMNVPGVLGMLVLDEVFGFLDASGAEGLMEALREVQAVVPSIYAISHDPQLQALFSGTITVIQRADGISRIEGGDAVDPNIALATAAAAWMEER